MGDAGMISVGKILNSLSKHLNRYLEKFIGVELHRARPKWHSSRILVHYLNKNPEIIIDAGANVGKVSEILSMEFPSAKIYAFEPVERSYKVLNKIAKRRRNILAFNFALSDSNGWLTMIIPADSESARICDEPSKSVGETVRVAAQRLDKWSKENDICAIDLLKIDAEGHDLKILMGCGNVLGNTRVVVCEVGFQKAPTPWCDFKDVFSFLSEAGFDLAGLYDVQYDGSGQLAYANALFVSSRQP